MPSGANKFYINQAGGMGSKNNTLDDNLGNAIVKLNLGAGSVTSTGNLTLSNNTLVNSAGTAYTLPTGTAGALALVSQLPTPLVVVYGGITGTPSGSPSSYGIAIVGQTTCAGFSVSGSVLTFPAVARTYSVTMCFTGSLPANTSATLAGAPAGGLSMAAGCFTGSQMNAAVNSNVYTLDNSFVVTSTSAGGTLTISSTGFTTNSGGTYIIRQLV